MPEPVSGSVPVLVSPTLPTPIVPKPANRRITRVRRNWLCFTWCLTWWIPTPVLRVCCKRRHYFEQIAWREKLVLNAIIWFFCGVLLFILIGLSRIICPKTSALSQGEIDGRKDIDKPYVSLYGSYYKIPDIVKSHVNDGMFLNVQAMKDTVLGRDVSAMFFLADQWDKRCPGLSLPSPGWDNIRRTVPPDAMTVWSFHRGKDKAGRPKDYLELINYMRKGALARDHSFVQGFLADDPANNYILIAYDK
eukprot:jgi/Hompol1/6274/HPOL_004905-RA